MAGGPFSPELFTFLAELRDNNDREWFAANKQRYETYLLEPALEFIADFGRRLEQISPHFRAIPKRTGGSLFRIYRDTRFSKDKTPYKPNVGIHFRHERAKDAYAPGFYLHLAPGECFGGGGIWHPDGEATNRIRTAIADHPERWREATRVGALQLEGSRLKRPPAGFDRDHPLIEDIKRKDFYAMTRLSERGVTAPTFVDDYARVCESAMPLVRFLCKAVDVPC
jgi:uncharacterized protein (TIGR02453 family)